MRINNEKDILVVRWKVFCASDPSWIKTGIKKEDTNDIWKCLRKVLGLLGGWLGKVINTYS